MSLFKNQTTSPDIADENDVISTYAPLESGVYAAKISLAYGMTTASGATGLVLQANTPNGQEFKQTLYTASGNAKGNKNYYQSKSGEKVYLPDFLKAQSLSLLACGKQLHELEPETKVVNVYDNTAKADVPTKVEMLVELLGKDVKLGLVKQKLNKHVKNNSGTYVNDPSGAFYEKTEINKVFRASDDMTVTEVRAKAENATTINTWEKKWTGKTQDRFTPVDGTSGTPAAATAPSASRKPTTSLFTD